MFYSHIYYFLLTKVFTLKLFNQKLLIHPFFPQNSLYFNFKLLKNKILSVKNCLILILNKNSILIIIKYD